MSRCLEITWDIHCYLSGYPDFISAGGEVSAREIKRLMQERYAATYGEEGYWSHIKS